MNVEMPAYGVGLWLEGDAYCIRFPDQQLIKIPVGEEGRLRNVLRHREAAVAKGQRPTIGTLGAPVQYDIDLVAETLKKEDLEKRLTDYRQQVEDAKAGREARERQRRERRIANADKLREADRLLAMVGLA